MAALAMSPAVAQAQPAAGPSDQERVAITIAPYLWLASLNGTVGVDSGSSSPNAGLSAPLNLTYFAACLLSEIRIGPASAIVDAAFTPVGARQQTTAGSGGGVSAPTPVTRSLVVDSMISYRVVKTERLALGLLGGVRIMHVTTSVVFAPSPDTVATEISDTWSGGILGARLGWHFSPRWFAHVKADAGGALPDELGSNHTWAVEGVVGWRVSSRASLVVGYRNLREETHDHSQALALTERGAIVGIRILDDREGY